ncbi:PEGA domain-containing protein [Nannocystis punicea]|uniref:PEGA domain-containing protein n=1 Tax=Nannocystis punicea TaxID=2995304 RepID=A0ABY7GZN8_9BACT|nr:PEGA domain-containing protein [Nannocystis poenicansa]WAS92451.1 PEGA domain-containing protein [Nannocystis poenicansa]
MRVPLCVLLGWLLAMPPAGVVWAAPAGGAATQATSVQIAVAPLQVAGQVDEATRTGWVAGLRRGLGRGNFTLLEQEVADRAGEPGCERQACLDALRQAGATHVVRTGITMKSRDFLLELELVDAASGAVIFKSQEKCEICGVGEVADLLDSQGALLQTRLAALGQGPPVLVLDTRPSGALVYVDGEVVGTTPLERPLLAGARKIRVTMNGYVAEEREQTFVAGAREDVVIELQRTPGNPRSRALGGAALGGGVALLGAGVALLALDDMPFKKRCSGTEVDADGDCRWLYNTGWGGAALAVSGAVLLTLGIVALVRNRAPRPSRSAVVLPTGLGVMARF